MPKTKEPVRSQKRSERPQRVMPDREREELLSQIEQEKAFQAGLGRALPENGNLGALAGDSLTVDKSKIAKRISTMSRALAEGEAPELRGAARSAAIARHRALEEKLPEMLMTIRDQDLFPRDGHDYHQAVRRATREIGNANTQKDIAEFRRLGRTLWPDDPDKSSIERLRKKH